MTEITIPGYKDSYIMFPRIQLDEPSIENGFRMYLINNQELTVTQKSIILKGFWDSREAVFPKKGDILLVDNVKYAHSRESYNDIDTPRNLVVLMAGVVWTDDSNIMFEKLNTQLVTNIISKYPSIDIFN